MKDTIRVTVVLLVICVIAGGILAFVYKKTAPIIEKNKKIEEENARKEVLPAANHFDAVNEGKQIVFYKGFDQNKRLVGYAFQCSKEGYSSTIQTMVGIDTLFQIVGVKVISQQETPGLGANCAKPGFGDRFKGKNTAIIQVNKDGGEIEAMTGATISTRAITNSIREKFLRIKGKLEIRNL